MNRLLRGISGKWRRPKHKGVSGNFSTIVIITGIVIGSYLMSGGGYPNPSPTYTGAEERGTPLAVQPKHGKEYSMTFRELLFRELPTSTPTPIPRYGGPPDDIGTDTPVCGKAALVFLVDDSSSMLEPASNGVSKLENVKTAINTLGTTLPDDALFGLYTFSSPNGQEPRERIPIGPFSAARNELANDLAAIDPPPNAATYMRQGFAFVQPKLAAAKQANPDYNFNLIFISDGVPEEQAPPGCQPEYTLTGTCGSNRNYDRRYDPTDTFQGQPDIPALIRTSGVFIYSVAIYNATDQGVFPDLAALMQKISSGPTYYYSSVGGTNLETINQQITATACS